MHNSLNYLTFMERIVSMDNFGLFFFWCNSCIARHTHQTSPRMIFTLFHGIKNIRIHLIFCTHELKALSRNLHKHFCWFGPSGSVFQCQKEPRHFGDPSKSLSGRVCSVFTNLMCQSQETAGWGLVDCVCIPQGWKSSFQSLSTQSTQC